MYEQTVFHSNTDDLEMWVEYDHGYLTIQFMDEFGATEKKYVPPNLCPSAIFWLKDFLGTTTIIFKGNEFLEPDYDFKLKRQDFRPLQQLFLKYKELQNEL